MSNTQSPLITFRRWAIFYIAVLVLLAGCWLFEKIPDGREELAGSVENTFHESKKVLVGNNDELLQDIQEGAENYPSAQSFDYKNRAEKAHTFARAIFENHAEKGRIDGLGLLRDSIIWWNDNDDTSRKAAQEIINEHVPKYRNLKTDFLLVQVQLLAALTLNYCYSKVQGKGIICNFGLLPYFMPYNLNPTIGEVFQAEISLEGNVDMHCSNYTAFLNDQPLSLREGIATIRTTFPIPGSHTLHVRFRRELCRDGSITEFSRDFHVNVLERCDSIPPR